MTEHFELAVQLRETLGTAASRRSRRQEIVPAILYGGELPPQALQIEHRVIAKALENEGFYTHILSLDLAGKKHKAILRGVQRHPFKPKVLHVDFMRVTGKETITMTIPLHFLNEETAIGVKEQGGMVEHLMVNVEVKCRSDHIPEYIPVDLAKLELHHSLHLSDLPLPKGVEIPALALGPDQNRSVVAIHPPQRGVEEVTATPEAPAPAKPGEDGKGEKPTS
jgi:large subunit ribosomal protein L25